MAPHHQSPSLPNSSAPNHVVIRSNSGSTLDIAHAAAVTTAVRRKKPHIHTRNSERFTFAAGKKLHIAEQCFMPDEIRRFTLVCKIATQHPGRAVRALAPHHQPTRFAKPSDPNGGMIVEQGAFCRGRCEGVDWCPRPSRCPMTRRENAQRGPAALPLLQSTPTGARGPAALKIAKCRR